MGEDRPIHPAARDPDDLLRACSIERMRGAGPGGQHRNKTETAVRLTHPSTGVTAQAGERRSQAENQRMALRRLRLNLALSVRSEMRDEAFGAPPSELWRGRCHAGRIAVNPRHQDFPALLAEALDAIAAHHDDVGRAAKALGVSMSQLVKFLKLEPAAMHQVNQARRSRDMKPLR